MNVVEPANSPVPIVPFASVAAPVAATLAKETTEPIPQISHTAEVPSSLKNAPESKVAVQGAIPFAPTTPAKVTIQRALAAKDTPARSELVINQQEIKYQASKIPAPVKDIVPVTEPAPAVKKITPIVFDTPTPDQPAPNVAALTRQSKTELLKAKMAKLQAEKTPAPIAAGIPPAAGRGKRLVRSGEPGAENARGRINRVLRGKRTKAPDAPS